MMSAAVSTKGMASAVRTAASANQGAFGFNAVRCMSGDSRPRSETGRVSRMTNINKNAGEVPELTAMKRGQGFRSSFSGKVATLFGVSGSLGRHVANRVGKTGTQVIIPYRGDHYDVLRLKLIGDLGQTLFSEFHLQDEASIMKAIKHSDVVINMVGREWETKNFSFDDVHNTGARMLARCARQAGARTFIHVSHLLASENPDVLVGKGSEYLKSKWRGDMAVLEEFPDATIIRSSEMVGVNDWFTRYYHAWGRRGFGYQIPLWRKGHYTIKAPVTAKNVTDAVVAAMDNPNAKGKIYEAVGPERYTLHDLVEYMYTLLDVDWAANKYQIMDLRLMPLPLVKAFVIQNMPFGQKFFTACTLEKLLRSSLSDVSQGYPSIEQLGVQLEAMPDVLFWHMEPWRKTRYLHGPIDPTQVPLRALTRTEEQKIHAEGQQTPFKILGL